MTFLSEGGGDLSVTVTGREDGALLWANGTRDVYQSSSGLGVVGKGIFGYEKDFLKKRLDGAGSTESLMFDFSPTEVTLDTITFNLVDSIFFIGDTVSIAVNSLSNTIWTGDLLVKLWETHATVSLDLASLGLSAQERTGLNFAISSPGLDDGVAIGGMAVSYTPASAVVVPTPTALGGGIVVAGLVALRRRGGIA